MNEIDPPFAVLHVPHASRAIPAMARGSIALADDLLSRELLRMTDGFTDELFRLDPRVARSVVFPVSRLVVDPERFLDDVREPMAARGMGVVYTRTADGGVLRNEVEASVRETLINDYYRPRHEILTHAVDAALDRYGGCVVVDCHSFPSAPLPYEIDQSHNRPEICVGTDDFHSPESLVHSATRIFQTAGFKVLLDAPFSGALVPGKHYRQDPRVIGLMVEVNRALYMDEGTGERLASFPEVGARLRACLLQIIDTARQIATS